MSTSTESQLSALDQQLIVLTQKGLPLVARPYRELAEKTGVSESLVQERFNHMLESGKIRRIAVVPNHYRIGYTENGMSVWDIPDEKITELGKMVGELDFVSHCYERPRKLPDWRFNLFAMVHGSTREEVISKADEIKKLLGENCSARDILFSTEILKKTGFRVAS